ncbi:hypothetical protein TNCV_2376391 [Trichonephila clavipes]|nr:hypothetical protein TNCV_2376391 [Trichonephila clavipes]
MLETASSVEDPEEADCNQRRDSTLEMRETHQSRFSMPNGGQDQVFSEHSCTTHPYTTHPSYIRDSTID